MRERAQAERGTEAEDMERLRVERERDRANQRTHELEARLRSSGDAG